MAQPLTQVWAFHSLDPPSFNTRRDDMTSHPPSFNTPLTTTAIYFFVRPERVLSALTPWAKGFQALTSWMFDRSFGLLEPIRGGQGIAVTPILSLTPSDALSCLHFSDFELALLRITSNKNGEILTPSYFGCYDPLVASTP